MLLTKYVNYWVARLLSEGRLVIKNWQMKILSSSILIRSVLRLKFISGSYEGQWNKCFFADLKTKMQYIQQEVRHIWQCWAALITYDIHIYNEWPFSSYKPHTCFTKKPLEHIDGLVQERRNSIADALELRLSCTKLSLTYRCQPLMTSCFLWPSDLLHQRQPSEHLRSRGHRAGWTPSCLYRRRWFQVGSDQDEVCPRWLPSQCWHQTDLHRQL